MLIIIIVNYKNENKTIEYIQSELVKISIPYKVVVVNNAATDETNAILKAGLQAPLITDINSQIDDACPYYIVAHADNLGFAKGNNLGADFARNHFSFEYILFSNNDIRFIDSNVVERLILKLDESPANVGGIGPAVLGLKGEHQSPIIYLSFFTKWFLGMWVTPYLSSRLREKIYKLDRDNYEEGIHYAIMGSFILLRSDDFFQCGCFDPHTFLYGEEVILAERLLRINKHFYYYPQVQILHDHGMTISQYYSKYNRAKMQFQNDVYYFKTYRGLQEINRLFCWWTLKFRFFLYSILKK